MNQIVLKDISEEINKAFSGLTFNWPYFVFSLLTLGVLTLLVTLLVYKPIKRMVKERQDFIQNNIDESIKAKEEALKAQENIDKQILDASHRANDILNDAKSESERIISHGSEVANKKVELILEQAHILTEKNQKEFEKNQRKIIMENAIEIAKKIIKREIKDADNLKMIKEVIEEN
ncbi:hypothetical protein [Metamycoplasma buccale]|uniref:F0F1 ATP synthase subunit B family protein n=1 Tax=Metamycoplasma buccale TaxID=55602 RepID=UPI00398ED20B